MIEKVMQIVIYGARQVGKTTLVKSLFENKDYLYLNGDEFDIQQLLNQANTTKLQNIIGKYSTIIIDEAQRITNIGLTLKLIYDNFPDKLIVATGSSSFELANYINEPLTGRKVEFTLYPFSVWELSDQYSSIEISRMIEQWMITGMYPSIVTDYDEKYLKELVNSYVYKDILSFGKIKKTDGLIKLLQSLALQIGNEVSYHELGSQCGLDAKTVEQYVVILEQAFIVFRLSPYTTNQRTGIKKLKKIYFWDLWVRNAIINNLNPMSIRNDTWWIRENYAIVELIKHYNNQWISYNYYFRRDQNKELDLVVQWHWKLCGYEIKYSQTTLKHYEYIRQHLKLSTLEIINKDNLLQYT